MTNSQQVSRANHIMKRSFQPTMAALLLAVTMTLTPGIASAAVIEFGDLNFIQDGGNPSNGLRFLDMTFSDGASQAAALANAQATYPDARLATATEWDHLFAAAGIEYDGAETASDAVNPGGPYGTGGLNISSGNNYDGGTLRDMLGHTWTGVAAAFWSDISDESSSSTSTRDYLFLHSDGAYIHQNWASGWENGNGSLGWLIVSETAAIPEPSTALLLCLGLMALATGRWNR